MGHFGSAENARKENARLENAAPYCKSGKRGTALHRVEKRETEKCGNDEVWKSKRN